MAPIPLIMHDYSPLEDTSLPLVITGLVNSFVPLLAVLFRFWSRKRYQVKQDEYSPRRKWLGPWKHGWALDDYLLLLSATLCSAGNVLIIYSCYLGFGKRQQDLIDYADPGMPFGGGERLIEETMKIFFMCQVLYTVVMMLTKASILLMFIRGFAHAANRNFRIICWCLLITVVCFYTGSVFVTVFQCWPISGNWTGQCQPAVVVDNLNIHWWTKAVFKIVTDLIIANLPLFYVVFTRRSWKEKIAGLIIIILSNTVVAFAIARTVMIPPADFFKDPMYHSINFCMFSVLEDAVGTVCACIPAFKEPILHLLRRLRGRNPWTGRRNSEFWCRGVTPVKHSDDEESLKSQSTPPKEKDQWRGYNDAMYGEV